MTTTTLAVTERAVVALGAKDYELKLAEMVKSSARIADIKNPDGYKECHGARMQLKTTRVEIEKTGKTAREDAQAFSKAVIAEEKRLVALITPEEQRLQTLQDTWDAERERERADAERIEKARTDAHLAAIADIEYSAVAALAATSEAVREMIGELMLMTTTAEDFEEFADRAHAAKTSTLATLQDVLTAKLAVEAEVAERERIAAEQKIEADRLAAERAAWEAEQAAARAAQADIDRRAAAVRAAEQAKFDAQRAELKRQQDEFAAEQRRQQEAAEAAEQAKRDAWQAQVDAERAEAARKQAEADAAEQAKADAEAARLKAIEDARMKMESAAEARTRQLRADINGILDTFADAELRHVLAYLQSQLVDVAA